MSIISITDYDQSQPQKKQRNLSNIEKDITDTVEHRLIKAAHVLRRLPDREAGFLYAKNSIWPEYKNNSNSKSNSNVISLNTSKPTPAEIDDMQPTFDLLLLLPNVEDRKLLFWAAWHQRGEKQSRIPWKRVASSMSVSSSRWTLKRKYQDALMFLVNILMIQVA